MLCLLCNYSLTLFIHDLLSPSLPLLTYLFVSTYLPNYPYIQSPIQLLLPFFILVFLTLHYLTWCSLSVTLWAPSHPPFLTFLALTYLPRPSLSPFTHTLHHSLPLNPPYPRSLPIPPFCPIYNLRVYPFLTLHPIPPFTPIQPSITTHTSWLSLLIPTPPPFSLPFI